MSPLRKKRLDKARAYALKPDALTYDLDIDGDYMRNGLRPPERAFQLMWCSFDLLLASISDAFPASGRSAGKGARYMRQDLFLYGGIATRYVAHAFPTLLDATQGCLVSRSEPLDPELPPEHYGVLARVLADFYPLRKGEPQLLTAGLAEFRVLQEKQVRPAVAKGDATGTRYSEALLRGEDPDSDPELVEEQWTFARDFFVNQTGLHAARFLLRQDFRKMKVADVLFDLDETGPNPKARGYLRDALAAWVTGSKSILEFARLDYAATSGTREAVT